MGSDYDRGLLLLQQARYDLAAEAFRKELAYDPQDATSHALLATCLIEQERYDEAMFEAKSAIRLEPDHPYSHYTIAHIFYKQDRYLEAERAIAEAIKLDPEDADYDSLRAAIMADQGKWEETLRSAEHGLENDPEHIGCANLRAMALVRLNRRDEAGATMASALARNPNSGYTHANQGWTLLHQGDHRQAFEHFREALRLEPDLEYARQGIVEAMKAGNPIYRPFLGFFLWLSRLSGKAQGAVFLAIFLGPRFLRSMARANPALGPWLIPLSGLILLFVALTWVADPLFNLFLRIDKFGRKALSREQIVASNWIGGCLVGVILGVLVYAITGRVEGGLAAIGAGLLMVPVSATFHAPPLWRRLVMGLYTAILAAMIAGGIAFTAMERRPGGDPSPRALETVALAVLGTVISTWVALITGRRS